ncbi:sensor histidine kinase [Kitasatospora sp. NPDC088783]|uniref:sensor histidine kinase n=1 Tax=Kitasatospora sp. NPDC088783 TaxID=3364077 RepID=UPI0037FA6B1D
MGEAGGGGWPRRAVAAVGAGLWRCAVLTALTCLPVLVAGPVGWAGSALAYSWSAGTTAALPLRVLAVSGETLLVLLWVAVALWTVHPFTSRALAGAARRCAARWLGLESAVEYRRARPVTRMATGHWWDGREYHASEREARRRAAVHARFHDPQLHGDGVWLLAAAGTVLPLAVLPLLALGCGAALTPAHPACGPALVAAGLAAAPFGWRALGPVGRRLLGPVASTRLGRRVAELEAVRADLTQTQAAELERIERGLHDGAQARLVALGMSVGAAEHLVDRDPAAAKRLLAAARADSVGALAELRALVRGINPPVLVERGLVDAVRALALDAAVEVDVVSLVPVRPERPVEAALYFCVAELLTNAVKHAHADRIGIELAYADRTLTATVSDDGTGGAAASPGSGLSGVERRVAAFGGRLEIDSPVGGPTRITVAVPCESS